MRIKFISTPPEWIQKQDGSIEYIAPYHCVRLINGPTVDDKSAVVSFNGAPNQSIPWMKAMTIEFIKKFIPQDKEANLLAKGEKIMATSYDHPPPTTCDYFSAIIGGEIDCTRATYTWLDNLAKENPYKIYPDSDLEYFHIKDYDEGEASGTGSPVFHEYPFDNEALANIESMMGS